MVITVIELADEAVFPAVKNCTINVQKLTCGNVHVVLDRDLVRVDHDEVVVNSTLGSLTSEIEVSVVCGRENRIFVFPQ